MKESQYFLLCDKYLKGTCSTEEEILLIAYQEENELTDMQWLESDAQRIKSELEVRIQKSMSVQKKKHFNINHFSWQMAAAIAAVLLVGIYLSNNLFNSMKNNSPSVFVKKQKKEVKDILPGTENAVLTLSNGESIVLDGFRKGVISTNGAADITKTGSGLVISAKHALENSNGGVLNKIDIPRGGKYNIVLPDGTRVWLNSVSSLSFPTAFTGKERRVLLMGEAYFEVAKNKDMPFIVDVAGKQEVEVLGTHFNITSFAEDGNILTTLLEGSVKINYGKSKILIKPGEMAVNSLQNNLKVIPADLDEVMAWKNDMFIFNNENITSIMKKVSRWYDIDLVFKGNMSGINFDGNYSRSKGLKSLLKNIELTDKVYFVIEERRVTVIAK